MTLSRRDFLRGGGGLVGGMAAFSVLSPAARAALASVAPIGSSLRDIEHVVILIQENRSFDHYFGTMSGVIGFDDPDVKIDPITGKSVFYQLDPVITDGAGLILQPYHLDTATTKSQCLFDVGHDWATQHVSLANGSNSAWLTAHIPTDVAVSVGEGDLQSVLMGSSRTMGYFTRADLPFHYALADAFTVCDRYFCSVLGPTNPNRHYSMSATIDPEGTHGGPDLNNFKTNLTWTTYPERLQAAGIDWYVYREVEDYQDNMLDHFPAFYRGDDLQRRGRSIIPTGQLAATLRTDVVNGNLPQVSWIVGPEATTEHPKQLPAAGAHFIQGILEALTADPKVWAKTALILTYDENGGFFDHVVPPLPPPGTPGEFISPSASLKEPTGLGIAGPIGLGFRVPTMVISPFTRGGYVCSDTFDHTSTLRFLETRFGVEVPNLTAWRRATCGDMTSAFNFAGSPDVSVPVLPDAAELFAEAKTQCATLPIPRPPLADDLPHQEPGTRPRPQPRVELVPVGAPEPGPPAGETVVAGTGASRAAPTPARERITLPATGGRDLTVLAAGAAVAAITLRRVRRAAEVSEPAPPPS